MNNSIPSQPAPLIGSPRSRQVTLLKLGCLIIASFIVMFIAGVIHTMSRSIVTEVRENEAMMKAHAVGVAMYNYADAHGGNYPAGNSSTEIFQQLLNGYVTDPSLFYLPMNGKIKADGKILKPENVCWDVTNAKTVNEPPELPLVFATGYRINYVPGGKAIPLTNSDASGFPVFYVDNSIRRTYAQPGGLIVIAPTFDPKGKTYRQLTPDGPLP